MCQTRSNEQNMEAAGPGNSRHQGCGTPGRGRGRNVELGYSLQQRVYQTQLHEGEL